MSAPRVARLDAYPLGYPEPNNQGKTRHICLVRIEADNGAVGWGEAVSGSEPASLATKIMAEQELAPLVVGRDPRHVAERWQQLRDATYWTGNGGIVTFAISAIDMALWDLAGRMAGLPVCDLLGPRRTDRIRAASSVIFDTADLDGIGRQFADLRSAGYSVLKGGWGHELSIAFGRDADRDLAIVRTVREAAGDDAEIIVDVVAGAAWTPEHAIRMATSFAPYRLYWLEDALTEQDVAGWQELRAATSTRLCTGEKGWTAHHYDNLIRSGAIDVVMIDPARAEGITGAKAVIDRAAAAGLFWNAHCWSGALNTAAALNLAAASSNTLVLELKPLPSPMQHELVDQPISMRDGWVDVTSRPGLGVEVDEAVVRRYLVR